MVLKNKESSGTNAEVFIGNLDFLVFFLLVLVNFTVAEILNLRVSFYIVSFLNVIFVFSVELREDIRKNFFLLISTGTLILISALPILIEIDFSSGFRFYLSNVIVFVKTFLRSLTMICVLIILSSKNDISDFAYVLSKLGFNKNFITFFVLSCKAIENIYVVFRETIESQISRNGYSSEKASFNSIIFLIQGGTIKTISRIEDTLLAYESKNVQDITFLEKDYKLTVKPFLYESLLIFSVVMFYV